MDKPWLTKECLDCGKKISKNSKRCAKCAQLGKKHTEETKRKIAKTLEDPYRKELCRQNAKKALKAVKEKALKKYMTNPNIKIGKRGYKLIYRPEDARDNLEKKGWIYYHHYVFCKHHNIRKIPKGYCIHHIDRNTLNNDLDNLQLMTIKEHDNLPKRK